MFEVFFTGVFHQPTFFSFFGSCFSCGKFCSLLAGVVDFFQAACIFSAIEIRTRWCTFFVSFFHQFVIPLGVNFENGMQHLHHFDNASVGCLPPILPSGGFVCLLRGRTVRFCEIYRSNAVKTLVCLHFKLDRHQQLHIGCNFSVVVR